MAKSKQEWISFFRGKAAVILSDLVKTEKDEKDKAGIINKKLTTIRKRKIDIIKNIAITEKWSNEKLVNEILLLTYSSYIVMLESRNVVWKYDYMAFSRRIGELWEPFCKIAFEYPVKPLSIITPIKFDDVQDRIKLTTQKYIQNLDLDTIIKQQLLNYYSIPWRMVDSGGIKLDLDLHFEQNKVHYNCDFKSGFSSNEKGNTNRLLLVASIYNSLGNNEKTLLFVRQSEDENNHYLQTLKNSQYWEVYCAEDCYAAIYKFTGINLRQWINENIDWCNDIDKKFAEHLRANDLLKYLTW